MKKRLYILLLLSSVSFTQMNLMAMEQKSKPSKLGLSLAKRKTSIADILDLRRFMSQIGQYVDVMALTTALANHFGLIGSHEGYQSPELSDYTPAVKAQIQRKKLVEILITNIKLRLISIPVHEGKPVNFGAICRLDMFQDFLMDLNRYYHSSNAFTDTIDTKRKKSVAFFEQLVDCFDTQKIERLELLGAGVSVNDLCEKIKSAIAQGDTDIVTSEELKKLRNISFIAPYFQYVHIDNLRNLLHAIIRIEEVTEEQLISVVDFAALFADEAYTEEELEIISTGCRKVCLIVLELAQDPSIALLKLLKTLNSYQVGAPQEPLKPLVEGGAHNDNNTEK